MSRSFRLGTIAGFPIDVNITFLFLLAAVLFWMGGIPGLVVVAIVFGSILVHELGHALVARQLGVRVSGIELHFFGGAAKMIDQPRSANGEIAIAAAGPAVSLMLAGAGLGLGLATGGHFLQQFGWINLVIAAFNLMPALPMDGGRIFRALLSRRMSFAGATELAVKVSRGFSILLGLYGLGTGNLQLALVAVVIWMLGSQELRAARLFGGQFVGDASGYRMRRDDEAEVMPRGQGWAGGGSRWQDGSGRRFVIRQRGGHLVVEPE